MLLMVHTACMPRYSGHLTCGTTWLPLLQTVAWQQKPRPELAVGQLRVKTPKQDEEAVAAFFHLNVPCEVIRVC